MAAELMMPKGRKTDELSISQEAPSMAEMLEKYLSCQQLERGQIVAGTVVRMDPGEIVVDVGAKCEGVVPARDLEGLAPSAVEGIHVGDEVLVYVVSLENATDSIILSLSQAQIARDWREAERLLERQEMVERTVAACNKGGVIVRIGQLRGFVPGSQLAPSRAARQASEREGSAERYAGLVGETLQLKVIEVDQTRNRLILSERAAVREWRQSQRERLLNELTEGDIRRGRVANLADFGAFVDLGGMDGLVHLSELSWKRVAHPREVLKVGEEVDVYVLGVDRERERVALSLKRLQPDPWATVEERYHEGQLVQGTVTRLTKWGAFARIVGDEAIEGLIHVSELDDVPVVHPRDVVEAGQVVTLRVLNVDQRRHRMALSLKQAAEGEVPNEDWKSMLAKEQEEPESALSAALSKSLDGGENEEGATAGG
jgi:small subunit ribosomal protein S1